MEKLIKRLTIQAKLRDKTIILPEANLDERVYKACKIILNKKLSKIIVFGRREEFDKSFSSPLCQIIDIPNYKNLNSLAKKLYNIRKDKGITQDECNKLILNPSYFAVMLLQSGVADGIVAGAHWSTASTLRPALQILKTKKGKSKVTGSMLLVKNGCSPLLFGDVSLIENPDSALLSEIAISNAEFMQNVLDITPKVAMLSYSTFGSAKGEMVQKVKLATNLAQKNSKFYIDGEMQLDAALNKSIALKKGLISPVAGEANVLIYPDLNSGNIAYKLANHLANYTAIGPLMLNLTKPVNDLSRGCTIKEIVLCLILTKIMCK